MSSKVSVSVGSVAACCSPKLALNQLISMAGRKRMGWSCHLSSNLLNQSPCPLVSFKSMVNTSWLQWASSGASRLRKNINFSLISRGNSESLQAWSVARGCWPCAVCYFSTSDLYEKGTTCHWGVVHLSKMDGAVSPMMVSVQNVSVGGCWSPLQPLCRKSSSSSLCLVNVHVGVQLIQALFGGLGSFGWGHCWEVGLKSWSADPPTAGASALDSCCLLCWRPVYPSKEGHSSGEVWPKGVFLMSPAFL